MEITPTFAISVPIITPSVCLGILWNDPEIGIQWPMKEVELSDKDKRNPLLFSQAVELLPLYSTNTE